MIGEIFNLILYQPLFNALVLLYLYLPGRDLGLSIIALTILIRFLLYPLSKKAVLTQKRVSEIQPKLKQIEKKYKSDPEQKVKKTLELYRQAKINPGSAFLPLLVQLPVLIALYRLFWIGISSETMVWLYSFVPAPAFFNNTFFGLVDLAKPSVVLAVLAAFFQFWQTKSLSPKTEGHKAGQPDFAQLIQKQMAYFFPVITLIFLIKLPSAIGLYWTTTTLFSLGQQYFVMKNPFAKKIEQQQDVKANRA